MRSYKTRIQCLGRLTRGVFVCAVLLLFATDVQASSFSYEIFPYIVTVDDPANHVVSPGGPLDGVGDVIVSRTDGTFRGSGTLLPTGRHVLTAAHLVTDDSGLFILDSGTVKFEGDSGSVTIPIANTTVHPDWDGSFLRGNDVAVLELATFAPAEISRYDIDRTLTGEVGASGKKAGYGKSGTGDTGATLPSGTKRSGFNVYDTTADLMLIALGLIPDVNFVPGSVLQYDFDNGLAANDAFGFFFGEVFPTLIDTGLGDDEVSAAPGDSGGPTLIDQLIVGITSYGIRLSYTGGLSPDIDEELNISFGEFGGDTRVALYADFIDSASVVPIPTPIWLFGSGLVCLAAIRNRFRKK